MSAGIQAGMRMPNACNAGGRIQVHASFHLLPKSRLLELHLSGDLVQVSCSEASARALMNKLQEDMRAGELRWQGRQIRRMRGQRRCQRLGPGKIAACRCKPQQLCKHAVEIAHVSEEDRGCGAAEDEKSCATCTGAPAPALPSRAAPAPEYTPCTQDDGHSTVAYGATPLALTSMLMPQYAKQPAAGVLAHVIPKGFLLLYRAGLCQG